MIRKLLEIILCYLCLIVVIVLLALFLMLFAKPDIAMNVLTPTSEEVLLNDYEKNAQEYIEHADQLIDPKHAWYSDRTGDPMEMYAMGWLKTELGSDAGHAQGEMVNNAFRHMADPTFEWNPNYGGYGLSAIGNTNNNYTSKYENPQKEAEYQHFLKEIPQDVRDENRYDLRGYYAKMTGLNWDPKSHIHEEIRFFEKPSSATFSVQSIYSSDINPGKGAFVEDKNGHLHFVNRETFLTMKEEGIVDDFKKLDDKTMRHMDMVSKYANMWNPETKLERETKAMRAMGANMDEWNHIVNLYNQKEERQKRAFKHHPSGDLVEGIDNPTYGDGEKAHKLWGVISGKGLPEDVYNIHGYRIGQNGTGGKDLLTTVTSGLLNTIPIFAELSHKKGAENWLTQSRGESGFYGFGGEEHWYQPEHLKQFIGRGVEILTEFGIAAFLVVFLSLLFCERGKDDRKSTRIA